jgi:hypothetical protein
MPRREAPRAEGLAYEEVFYESLSADNQNGHCGSGRIAVHGRARLGDPDHQTLTVGTGNGQAGATADVLLPITISDPPASAGSPLRSATTGGLTLNGIVDPAATGDWLINNPRPSRFRWRSA